MIFPPAAAPFVALMDGYVALPPSVPGCVAVPLSVALSCDRVTKVDRRRHCRGIQSRRYRQDLEALAGGRVAVARDACRAGREFARQQYRPTDVRFAAAESIGWVVALSTVTPAAGPIWTPPLVHSPLVIGPQMKNFRFPVHVVDSVDDQARLVLDGHGAGADPDVRDAVGVVSVNATDGVADVPGVVVRSCRRLRSCRGRSPSASRPPTGTSGSRP